MLFVAAFLLFDGVYGSVQLGIARYSWGWQDSPARGSVMPDKLSADMTVYSGKISVKIWQKM